MLYFLVQIWTRIDSTSGYWRAPQMFIIEEFGRLVLSMAYGIIATALVGLYVVMPIRVLIGLIEMAQIDKVKAWKYQVADNRVAEFAMEYWWVSVLSIGVVVFVIWIYRDYRHPNRRQPN